MKKFLPLLLLASFVSAAPDCNWSGRWSNRPTDQADNLVTFKTNGTTPVPGPTINNTATGCSAWIMIVDVEGFSAVSVELDTAPAASPGVAGTFSSSNLTTTSGSNPTTSTTVSTYLATGYYPFFRANVTTVTGTPGSINIQIFGWRSQAYLTASSGGIQKGQSIYPCISSSGSSTTYTCTTGSSVTLADGMTFLWNPDETCAPAVGGSPAPTLNVDGNGAKLITLEGHVELNAGDCTTEDSTTLFLTYRSASGHFVISGNRLIGASILNSLGLCSPGSSYSGVSLYPIVGNSSGSLIDCANNNAFLGSNGIVLAYGVSGWGSHPSISGCSATISTTATNSAGYVTSGTGGTCTFTLTWGNSVAFPTGAVCTYNDVTTIADIVEQTTFTTTTAVASGTTVSGDVIYYSCIGF